MRLKFSGLSAVLLLFPLVITFTSCNSEMKKETDRMINSCTQAIEQRDLEKAVRILDTLGLNEKMTKKQQELYQNLQEQAIELEEKLEQERIEALRKAEEERRQRDLTQTPPKSVYDLKNRIDGTVWVGVLGNDLSLRYKYEFKNGRVIEYVKYINIVNGEYIDNGWDYIDSFEYTVTDVPYWYGIVWGDDSDLRHLKKTMAFLKSNNKVVVSCHTAIKEFYLESF